MKNDRMFKFVAAAMFVGVILAVMNPANAPTRHHHHKKNAPVIAAIQH